MSFARLLITILLVSLAAASPAAAHTGTYDLGDGAWSYFGDPRSIAHGDDVFSGWISTTGDVWVSQRNLRTGIYQGGVLSPKHEQGVAWFQARIARAHGEPDEARAAPAAALAPAS